MDRSDFLTCLPIFKHLDTEAAQALSAELEEKRLPAGATLFTQGLVKSGIEVPRLGMTPFATDVEYHAGSQ